MEAPVALRSLHGDRLEIGDQFRKAAAFAAPGSAKVSNISVQDKRFRQAYGRKTVTKGESRGDAGCSVVVAPADWVGIAGQAGSLYAGGRQFGGNADGIGS